MARIIGLVKRVADRAAMVDFYKVIGLKTKEQQHGGPLHDEVTPVGTTFVVEVYPSSKRYPSDALMIEVGNLKAVLARLESKGFIPREKISGGRMAYVRDPDGKDVLLVQA